MPLLFDQFGVRRVELEVLMWPGFEHGFHEGELSRLYGAVNTDDLFESCELRSTVGAQFESEHWTYDITTTRITITSGSFAGYDDLERRVLHLLTETKAFFGPRKLPYLTADRVAVRGIVPEETDRDVADVLRVKALANRLRSGAKGDRLIDVFPGKLDGMGLTFVGDTEDYHWHADVGPAHSYLRALPLTAELYFNPPKDPPEEAMIAERLKLAYQFITQHVVGFARKSLT